MEKDKKIKLCFAISVIIVIFAGLMAYGFQTNFGSIDVQEVKITSGDGSIIVGKLYRPVGVDATNPAPGILGIHGYNNDKDVQRGTALELARAGFVVLTIDQLGHGDSGSEFEASFSTQILGAQSAYIWLSRQSFVYSHAMGVYGHSMGYVSAFYFPLYGFPSDVDAPNAFIFETFPPALENFFVHRNILHIWSQYEEWYTVDMTLVGPSNITEDMTVSEIYDQGLIVAGMNAGLAPGTSAEVNTNYGSFALGNAYREHYVIGTTHPGQTMDSGVNQESVAWMLQALKGYSESEAWGAVASLGQTYLYLEGFDGLALLFSFISVLFLVQILLSSKFFAEVKQPMPERVVTKKKLNWWIYASINTAIAAVFFIFFTSASNDWNFGTNAPILIMGMMNNWLGFFLTTAAAAIFLIGLWYFLSNRKERGSITPYDLGMTYSNDKLMTNLKNKAHWQIFGKTLLLAGILFGWMYLLVSIFQATFLIEFRIFWSFAKMLTLQRFVQFLIYLPMFIPFFLMNGGVLLFGQIRQEEAGSSFKTYFIWWCKIIYATLIGLLVVLLVQYLGVAVSNYPFEGFPNAPIMYLQLMQAIPFYALLYFVMIFFFRKTGKIYLGAFFGAIITVWFLSAGTVFGVSL
ncbi:MAG: alpha/beta hydrolase [Candidatus Hermodarchaeota archaeon]